jgi:hypothetical protein
MTSSMRACTSGGNAGVAVGVAAHADVRVKVRIEESVLYGALVKRVHCPVGACSVRPRDV